MFLIAGSENTFIGGSQEEGGNGTDELELLRLGKVVGSCVPNIQDPTNLDDKESEEAGTVGGVLQNCTCVLSFD